MNAPLPQASSTTSGPETARGGAWRGGGWMLNRQSLRYQLTAGILMVLLPAFAISYAAVNRMALRQITQLTEKRLKVEAELISYGLREWGDSNRISLKALSFDQALRDRDIAGAQLLLNSLEKLYPGREWRYWSADPQPKLLAATGTITDAGRKRAEQNILKRLYFQDALAGTPSYSVVKSYLNNQICVMIAQPVYPRGNGTPNPSLNPGVARFADGGPLGRSKPDAVRPLTTAAMDDVMDVRLRSGVGNQKPTGVLLSCILLEHLGDDTGLKETLQDLHLTIIRGNVTDFSKAKSLTSAFILVSRHGHILYPTAGNKARRIPSISDYIHGYWGPIFKEAIKATKGEESFSKVRVGGESYFVLINRADTAWSTLLVLSEREAFASLHGVMLSLVLFGLACLALASAAIYWQCGRIIAPIRQAGAALQQISEGRFDTVVDHHRSDEIGALLDNVNYASAQLKLFLSKETAHAVTQKQLETAREIQKDFLVQAMPENARLEIAPVFLPAYDVGADWYDALAIGETTYFVVADVCDKGIPSALYMSVFRSLLRYGLLTHVHGNDDSKDPGTRLQEVITLVNDYMASNHRDSMMFATVFMAAINPVKRQLHYISAGHEMPLLSHATSHELLEQTGPAVGLFPGAAYGARTVNLEPGDYLVAYTDGLTDARSPANVGWGRDALVQFMAPRAGGSASAQQVLDDLLVAVRGHMGAAEPFDDLTVMVLHLLP